MRDNNIPNRLTAVSGEDRRTRANMRLLLLGVFLLSSSLLALEIALTRFLSVMLSYHYVFIVVSLALLGLGTGAIFVRFFKPQLSHGHDNGFSNLARFAGLFSLSVLFSIVAMVLSPVANILLFSFLFFIPFFFAGVFLAGVFRTFPELSSRIYGADLIGAAVGSIGVVFSLNVIGGPNTVFLLGIVLALVSLLFAVRTTGRRLRLMVLPVLSLLAALGLLWVNLANPYLMAITVGADPTKEIHHVLGTDLGGEIIETRWSAFGRTDLVAFRGDPAQMAIFIDGTAGTSMYRFNGDLDNPSPEVQSLKNFPGYLPFQFLKEGEKDNALIIGPGGGRDVLLALMGGVDRITAVEVNRDFVDIVKDYAWYNGGIYEDFDNVSVYVDEGRSFLRRQDEKYDIIMLSLPVTKTSRSLEGYALTESFLFTTDSIRDYLEHLTDEGRLIVVAHSPVEMFRLLSVSLAALEQLGMDNRAAMERVYMVGSDSFPIFVMKKSPFGSGDMVPVHQSLHQLGYDLPTSYLPGIRLSPSSLHAEEGRFDECSMLNPLFTAVERGDINFSELEVGHAQHRLDITPVTDDNPFFYNFEEGTPGNVSLILWVSTSILLLTVLVSLRRKKGGSQEARNPKPIRFALLFSMLGVGFMLAEVSLFQRFTLFLGQPVLSLTVSLASLLVGAGLGSLCSGRFSPEKLTKAIPLASLAIALALVVYALSLSPIFKLLLGLGLPIRVLATAILLAFLGFVMGFPFPLGLRLLKETKREGYIPWAWGINGLASVAGSVLTIAIAISFGFTEALLVAAGCYFIIFLAFSNRSTQRGFDFTEETIS